MVIDAFQFFNELDVLELRLHELDSVVDHFVIVESLEVHGSSSNKSAVLLENWSRVKSFEHKIKYVLLDHLEPEYTDEESAWKREHFQREALWPAVTALCTSDNDVVILSDCDEIPRATSVSESLQLLKISGLCRFCLDLYYYNVNRYVGPWTRSTIGTLAQYRREGGFQRVRDETVHDDGPKQPSYHKITNAGWHFSYFGDIPSIRLRCASFAPSHYEDIRAWLAQDDQQIAADIASGKNIFWRYGKSHFDYRPSNDPRLPLHFLRNPNRYQMFTHQSHDPERH